MKDGDRFRVSLCGRSSTNSGGAGGLLLPIIRDELNGPDVEAIVQIGTNLSMVRLADEAERWLGKPVLAINAATLWSATAARESGRAAIGSSWTARTRWRGRRDGSKPARWPGPPRHACGA